MSKTPKPSRLKLFLPYIILLGLFAAYGGFWLFASIAMKATIQKTEGLQLDDIGVAGFPSQFRIMLTKPAYSWPQGIIESDKVTATALVYKPKHIIFWAEGEQRFTAPSGNKLKLRADDIRASLVMEEDDVKRISGEIQQAQIDVIPILGKAYKLTADSVTLHTRPSRQPKAIDGDMENYILTRNLKGFGDTLIEMLESEFTIGIGGIADGANGLDISKFFIKLAGNKKAQGKAAGPLTVRGSGKLFADNQNRLAGTLNLQIVNLSALANYLVEAGLISQRDQRNLMVTTGFVSALSGDADNTLSLPLQFRNGTMSLGPVPIGSTPRIK